MNENHNSSNEGSDGAHSREVYRELDVINTQIQGQWQEGNTSAESEASSLINEVDSFLELAGGELYTKQEYDRLLQKLDTAIAINNEPYARELRTRLIERYA